MKRCLGRNQGRSDDNEESLKKRVVTYENQTLPIIQHYEKSGKVRKIDASKSVEEVKQFFSRVNFDLFQTPSMLIFQISFIFSGNGNYLIIIKINKYHNLSNRQINT